MKDAYVKDYSGKKIINFKSNNLHLVGYSTPINQIISKEKFIDHLHSLPDQPNAIPYITSYYKKYWGFCVSHKQKKLIQNHYKK